jgi:hypothetical protein
MGFTLVILCKKLPTHDLDKANEIRDYILQSIPLDSGKRFITRLAACCSWAIQSGMISENPFEGMAAEIKLPKSSKSEGINDINSFTLEERDAIIQAIESDRFCPAKSAFKHSRYAPLIKLLCVTGCRPSEAIANLEILKQQQANNFSDVVIPPKINLDNLMQWLSANLESSKQKSQADLSEVINRVVRLSELAKQRRDEIKQLLIEIETNSQAIAKAQENSKALQNSELFARYQKEINRDLYAALDRLEAIRDKRNH